MTSGAQTKVIACCLCQCLVCNGRTTTSAARPRAGDPCEISSLLEKHTVAPIPSGAASEGGPALVRFPWQGRHPTEGGILGGNSSDEQNSFTAKPRIARVLL